MSRKPGSTPNVLSASAEHWKAEQDVDRFHQSAPCCAACTMKIAAAMDLVLTNVM